MHCTEEGTTHTGRTIYQKLHKKEHPGFVTKSKPLHWCKYHTMWCVQTSDQFKVGNKQAADRMNNKKPSSSRSTKEQAMASMIDIFGNHDESNNEE